MDRFLIRPRVADLILRLYDRPLHPELFDALAVRHVRRNDYSLTIRLTPTGHVLEWHRGEVHLVEVTATAEQDLPTGGRLTRRFVGERRGRLRVGNGVRYEMELQTELLPPEVYLHVHDELAAEGAKRGMLFHFRPRHRLGLTPLGLVTVDALPTGLAVATFHTFPDEYAVVKTQSLIEPTL
jgi:hypothetical protein